MRIVEDDQHIVRQYIEHTRLEIGFLHQRAQQLRLRSGHDAAFLLFDARQKLMRRQLFTRLDERDLFTGKACLD